MFTFQKNIKSQQNMTPFFLTVAWMSHVHIKYTGNIQTKKLQEIYVNLNFFQVLAY